MGRMGLRTLSSLGLAMGLLRNSAIDLSLPPRQRWMVTPEPIREHETLLGTLSSSRARPRDAVITMRVRLISSKSRRSQRLGLRNS